MCAIYTKNLPEVDMIKNLVSILALILFHSNAKAKAFKVNCFDQNTATLHCYPELAEDKIELPYQQEYEVFLKLDSIPSNHEFYFTEKKPVFLNPPLVIEEGFLVLPNNKFLPLENFDLTVDPESELEEIINNPDIWINSNPILAASWSELDKDVKKK